jgi:hypothetical protein
LSTSAKAFGAGQFARRQRCGVGQCGARIAD